MDAQADILPLSPTGATLSGTVMHRNYLQYKFLVPAPAKLITIKLRPADAASDPDLYVSSKLPRATKRNFQWSSTSVGAVCLQIHPADLAYSIGWYYVGVYGAKPGANSFSITVALSDPPAMLLLESQIESRAEVPPRGAAFFKYLVKGIPAGAVRHLRASPGAAKIVLCFSKELPYPDTEFCQWSSKGFTSASCSARETEPELDPFVLGAANGLEYNHDLAGPYSPDTVNPGADSIGLKVDRFFWKLSNRACYVGIYNQTEQKLSVTVSIAELQESDLIPTELRSQLALFTDLFAKIEGATVSKSERFLKKLLSPEFTYGEIELVHFLTLLRVGSRSKQGVDTFWDLGCGTGKALVAAAMSPLGFKRICGVELLDGLCVAAGEAVNGYCTAVEKQGRDPMRARFSVVKGDIRVVDWLNADVIYAASMCFPDALMKEITERGKALRKGTRIITLKNWNDPATYKILSCCRVRMTWGKTKVYILERL